MDNRQARTEIMENRPTIPRSVDIIGCGGIGTWVAIINGMAGTKRFYLFDADTVEEHNLNRLPFGDGAIGKSKTEVLKAFLESMDNGVEVMTFGLVRDELDLEAIDDQAYVYICCDNRKTREFVSKVAQKRGLYYVNAGYNENSVSVYNGGKIWGSGPDAYETTPTWAVPTFVVSALAVFKMSYGCERDLSFDLFQLFDRRDKGDPSGLGALFG